MKLLLIYDDSGLEQAWREHFNAEPDVDIVAADVRHVDCDALVIPCTCSGAVGERLGTALTDRFGPDALTRMRESIARRSRSDGRGKDKLYVGGAEMLPAGNNDIPWLIAAPTEPDSGGICSDAPHSATRAALLQVKYKPPQLEIDVVAMPGMRASKIPDDLVALQMWNAYREVIQNGIARGPCYCYSRSNWESGARREGLPPGFCGECEVCGEPGHTRHHPGDVPYTSAWCDEHYDALVEHMRSQGLFI